MKTESGRVRLSKHVDRINIEKQDGEFFGEKIPYPADFDVEKRTLEGVSAPRPPPLPPLPIVSKRSPG